jgi:DNA-binding XRE family transcriptional regulator
MIYFIKQYWSIPIRIGIATDIKKRIQKLQSGSAKKLSRLKVIRTENDYLVRRVIYTTLQDLRIEKSSWFVPNRMMKIFLDSLKNNESYRISDILSLLFSAQAAINETKIRIDVDKIKEKMKTMNYDQSALAKKIGHTRQAISLNFQRGQTSSQTVKKLAEALECKEKEITVDGR